MDKYEWVENIKCFFHKLGRRYYLEKIVAMDIKYRNQLENIREVVVDDKRKKFILEGIIEGSIISALFGICFLIALSGESANSINILNEINIYLYIVAVIFACCLIPVRCYAYGKKTTYRISAYYCKYVTGRPSRHMLCYYDFVKGRYRFQKLTNSWLSKYNLSSHCEEMLIDVIAVSTKRQVKILYSEKIHNPKL